MIGHALALLSEDSPRTGYSIGALTPKAVHRSALSGQPSGPSGWGVIRDLSAAILAFRTFGVNLGMAVKDQRTLGLGNGCSSFTIWINRSMRLGWVD